MPSSSSTPPPDQRSNAEIAAIPVVTVEHRAIAERVIGNWCREGDKRDTRTLIAQGVALGMIEAARALVASPGPGVDENGLLPCPFCQRVPKLLERASTISEREKFKAFVSCMCGGYSARAHQSGSGMTQTAATAVAIAAWNRRPSPAAAAGVVTVEMVGRAMGTAGFAIWETAEDRDARERLANALNALLSTHQ